MAPSIVTQTSTEEEPTMVYLAQHDLFEQIPSLREDFYIPDYCHTFEHPPDELSPLAKKHREVKELDSPDSKAWFGPAGRQDVDSVHY
jgi:hypothetical protein